MSSGIIGADPQVLRDLATKFDDAAEQLNGIRSSVEAWVDKSDIWRGMDNRQFAADWQSTGVRSVLDAAAALRRSADILRANANAQESVSAATDSMASGSGLFGVGMFSPSASPIAHQTADSPSFGREFLDSSREFLDLGVSRISTADLVSLLGGIGLKSGHGTALDLALAAPDLIDELLNPDASLATSVNSTMAVATDMTGGALFALGAKSNNPAVMLLGTGFMSVGLAMEAASEADFSPAGLQTTWDYAKENGGVVVEEFGKATVQVFQDLGKKMAGAFIGGKLGR